MMLAILIEPVEGGRFRARLGEPFALSAEGDSPDEATRHLETLIRDRLGAGSLPSPFYLAPLPDDDWFAKEMREAIAENRRREDEAGG